MTPNPFKPGVMVERSPDEATAQEMIWDWRRRRKRWNRRCHLISATLMLILFALAWGTGSMSSSTVSSTAVQSSNEASKTMEPINWFLLGLLGLAILIFVFGPISWYWAGQHERGDDDSV